MMTSGKRAVALILLLLPVTAEAKPKHWFTDPKWWVGTALMGAAIAADAHSTSRGVGMGLREENWALGPKPSNARIAGISLGYFGIQTALHAGAWHFTHHVPLADSSGYDEDRLGWRILGYTALPATVLAINGHSAAKNYRLE